MRLIKPNIIVLLLSLIYWDLINDVFNTILMYMNLYLNIIGRKYAL